MEWVNSTMEYGHCEGMAVLSILFQRGILNPADFGAARTRDLVLEGNQKLQREIAYWYATMIPNPGRAARIIAPPRDLVAVLRTAFANTQTAFYTLRFSKLDRSGGHSVVPMGLRDISANEVAIQVYDSNSPTIARELIVNTATNTWSYSPALDPNQTSDDYNGTAQSLTLGLAPIEPRQGQQTCALCAESDPLLNTTASSDNPIILPPTTTNDGMGNVNQGNADISNPEFITPWMDLAPSNPLVDSWSSPVLKYFVLQPNADGHFVLSAPSENQTNIPVSIRSIGRGYTFEVETTVASGFPSEVIVGSQGNVITFTTQTTTSPTMYLGFETPTDDFDFYIEDFDLSADDSFRLEVDASNKLVGLRAITAIPDESVTFSLSMERIDDQGIEIFNSPDEGISLFENEILLIDFSQWSGNGGTLRMGYDDNLNGLIDANEAFVIEDVGDTIP